MKNKECAKYNYFISYLHTSENTYGYGNTTIGLNIEIINGNVIEEIKQMIMNNNKDCKNVIILNIQRLPI